MPSLTPQYFVITSYFAAVRPMYALVGYKTAYWLHFGNLKKLFLLMKWIRLMTCDSGMRKEELSEHNGKVINSEQEFQPVDGHHRQDVFENEYDGDFWIKVSQTKCLNNVISRLKFRLALSWENLELKPIPERSTEMKHSFLESKSLVRVLEPFATIF